METCTASYGRLIRPTQHGSGPQKTAPEGDSRRTQRGSRRETAEGSKHWQLLPYRAADAALGTFGPLQALGSQDLRHCDTLLEPEEMAKPGR
jgi:hypothetical protein